MWSHKSMQDEKHEYSKCRWAVFETKNAGEPMIVRVNQAAINYVDTQKFNIRVGFSIPLNTPVPNGLPLPKENTKLNEVEDSILLLISSCCKAIHVLSITTGRFKEIMFYIDNDKALEKVHSKILKKVKTHTVQCYSEKDLEWDMYFNFYNAIQ